MTDSSDQGQIRALFHEYQGALNEADAAAAVAVYAEGGTFYPYDGPTAVGRAQLLGAYQQIFATIQLDVAFDVHEIVVDGDLAYATTSSAGQVTVLGTGLTAPEENREVFVLTRRDGVWKVARYMFNKPPAPAAP